jgi:hypothetical protein
MCGYEDGYEEYDILLRRFLFEWSTFELMKMYDTLAFFINYWISIRKYYVEFRVLQMGGEK